MAHQRLTGARLADLMVAMPGHDRAGVLERHARHRFLALQQPVAEGVEKERLTARLGDLDRAIEAFRRLDAAEGRRHMIKALSASVCLEACAEALREARVPHAPSAAPPPAPIKPVPDNVASDDLMGLTVAQLRDVWRRENGYKVPEAGALHKLRHLQLVQAIRSERRVQPSDEFERLMDLIEEEVVPEHDRAEWRKNSVRGRPAALAFLRKTAKHLPARPPDLAAVTNFDLFLSHRGASPADGCGTKVSIARPLADVLKHGFGKTVFLDRDPEVVRAGDVMGDAILRGLYTCRTAMVVLSEDFWKSSWCVRELAVLLRRRLTQAGDPVQLERLTFVAAGGTDKRNFGQGFEDPRVRSLRLNAFAGTSQRDGGRFRQPDEFVCDTLVASAHVLTRTVENPRAPSADTVAAAVRTAERVLGEPLWPGSRHRIFRPAVPPHHTDPKDVDRLAAHLARTLKLVGPSAERQRLEKLTVLELKAKLRDYVLPKDLRNKAQLVDAVMLRKHTRDKLKAAVEAAGLSANGTLKDDYVRALVRASKGPD